MLVSSAIFLSLFAITEKLLGRELVDIMLEVSHCLSFVWKYDNYMTSASTIFFFIFFLFLFLLAELLLYSTIACTKWTPSRVVTWVAI